MTAAAAYGGAALAVLKRDALIYVSYRARFVSQVLSVGLNVLLFYYVSRLVNVEPFGSPDEYFAFAVIGIVTLRGLATTFTTTVSNLRQELVAGTFERMLASPFGPTAGAVSLVLFPLVLAFTLAIATLAVATLLFGLELQWDTAPLAIPVAVLGALAFTPFALLLAAVALLFKQAGAGAGFILAGIAVVAGIFFPVELLPGWLQWASEVQPFTPALELMRNLLVGIPLDGSALGRVAKLAAFALVLVPLSLAALRGAVEVGRRRATITEY